MTKLELLPVAAVNLPNRDAGYITQMLRELAVLARQRDAVLAYLVEMALVHSCDVDVKERIADRREQAISG